MINIRLINKSYKDKQVFGKCHLIIKDNDFIAIKGLSGTGKTTLLNIIGLLDFDYDGEYILNNIQINRKNSEKYRRIFSYLFQTPLLIPYLNVIENITMPLKNKKIKIKESEIDSLMQDLNILDKKYSEVSILSGGEKTRVSLARAIAAQGKIIMIDEPTANLDPFNAKIVMNMINSMKNKHNLTIIIVTHNNDFDYLYNRVIEINNGILNEKK